MEYRTTKIFTKKQLEKLFISVKWNSGKYPKKLKKAMKNSDTVISAWDNGKLVGLMSAISDGSMNVFFPYLLFKPQYQGLGIGKTILVKMLNKYKNYYRKSLYCNFDKLNFYEKFGFQTDCSRISLAIEDED